MKKGSNVFYGEYSLRHWLRLLLRRNVILPDYQRHFVWDENKVYKLIETLRDKEFVPPVIIGAYNNKGVVQNLLLDGQQRLTSIIISYFGYMPDKAFLRRLDDERFADENDFFDEEGNSENILAWTFRKLLDEVPEENTDDKIIKRIKDSKAYKPFTNPEGLGDDFLDVTFLGFSYIVPNEKGEKEQQEFYSSVFRNINRQGVNLQPEESRESLYYLNKDLYQLFQPDFAKYIRVSRTASGNGYLDFTRYLALLFQYRKDHSVGRIARYYYGRQIESYYEEFIYHVVGKTNNELFYDFDSVFPKKEYQNRLKSFVALIQRLGLEKRRWTTIIDLDTYFFGLIYYAFIKEKSIDETKVKELFSRLDKITEDYKKPVDGNYHSKNPAALKYLRQRINDSIFTYREYLK